MFYMKILIVEGQLVQVNIIISLGYTSKQPDRREDATCEDASQSVGCAIFCQ
jgi:hypothetical protein